MWVRKDITTVQIRFKRGNRYFADFLFVVEPILIRKRGKETKQERINV